MKTKTPRAVVALREIKAQAIKTRLARKKVDLVRNRLVKLDKQFDHTTAKCNAERRKLVELVKRFPKKDLEIFAERIAQLVGDL